MRSRIAPISLLGTTLIAVVATGCVPYQTYKLTRDELEKAKEINADLTKKYNQAITRLMAKDQTGAVPADYDRIRQENDDLRRQLEKINLGFKKGDAEKVGGTEEPGGGIALGEALLFAEGQASIKPEGLKVLSNLVALLKSDYPREKVIIEGHTDNQPLDKTKERWRYNMILAWNRASSVFEYLVQHGIPEANIKCESYGPNKPLNAETASSPEGRRQNRRVVVRRGGEEF